MALLQKIWDQYKAEEKPDSILDQALATVSEKTGLSADDIISVADQIVKEKVSIACGSFALTKTAFGFEDLGTMEPSAAADLVARVMKSNDNDQKSELVRSISSSAERLANGDIKAIPLAQELKKRHMWEAFVPFYQKHVVPVRAGREWLVGGGQRFLHNKESLFYYWQEFTRGRGLGMPWYATMSILSKFIFIIIKRLLKFGMYAAIAGVTTYGIYTAYKFFNPTGKEADPTVKPSNETTKESGDLVDVIEQKLKTLYGPKDEK